MPLTLEQSAIIDAAQRKVVGKVNPLLADLPSWVEWTRLATQADVVKQIVTAFEDVNVVVLDAPTGSGKTLIAEVARRMMEANAVYTCSTIALQQQFAKDFADARLLNGRSNYATLAAVSSDDKWGVTCADCTFTKKGSKEIVDDFGVVIGDEVTYPCDWCVDKRQCPYEIAKQDALHAELAVLNMRYLLTEGNGPARFAGRELVIVDECDTLESELMGFVSVDISPGRAKWLGLRAPAKVTVASAWGPWMDQAIVACQLKRDALPRFEDSSVRERRDRKYLDTLIENLRTVRPQVEDGWVYTGSAKKEEEGTISFRPVRVDAAAQMALWPLSKKWLLMSATTISAEQLVRDDLGYTGEFRAINMGSTFPPANRPIYIQPAANMSRKTEVEERPKLLAEIVKVLDAHGKDSVLIHTVSYRLSGWLTDELRASYGELGGLGGYWTYTSSGEKDAVVRRFREQGGVLIAPSLDRGIDLPDDLCRVQVIAKIPFPNLGDRQVNARLHSTGGQTWYNVQAVRSLVQMCGRGVRHKNDRAVTYILDSQFDRLWNSARRLFPLWWVEAVKW